MPVRSAIALDARRDYNSYPPLPESTRHFDFLENWNRKKWIDWQKFMRGSNRCE
jgi:hypothetical protein